MLVRRVYASLEEVLDEPLVPRVPAELLLGEGFCEDVVVEGGLLRARCWYGGRLFLIEARLSELVLLGGGGPLALASLAAERLKASASEGRGGGMG